MRQTSGMAELFSVPWIRTTHPFMLWPGDALLLSGRVSVKRILRIITREDTVHDLV